MSVIDALYESVADGLADGTTPEQIEAAIGQTRSGSPSDDFWAAYDNEVGRIMDFFEGVRHDPIVLERMK